MSKKPTFFEFLKEIFSKQVIFHTISIGVVLCLLAAIFLMVVVSICMGIAFNPIEAFTLNTIIGYAMAYLLYMEYRVIANNIKKENKPCL